MTTEPVQEYLYKIVSLRDWLDSQKRDFLLLPKEDAEFIHLAKKEQLDKIIEKYWKGVSQLVILKLKSSELQGTLVYETNPGKTNRYYHLYAGSIPLEAVVESQTMDRDIPE